MTTTISVARAQEVHDRARARNGLPYGYGGAFTTNPGVSTDCSGLVLQTGAWYGGRTDWSGNRYGSTESFRLDYQIVYQLGFKRLGPNLTAARTRLAQLPFKPAMLVGLQHGGGGVYSHTACTLMTMDAPGRPVTQSQRGVDWESCGNGVFLYDYARGWPDPLFHDFWYLDAALEAAPAVNEIDREFDRCKAWIGRRLSGEQKTVDGTGVYSDCEGGRIYYKVGVRADRPVGDRAVAVPTHILTTYNTLGASSGPLGFPVLRHTTIPDVGDIQGFQRAVIYRQFGQPGIPVHGAILGRYAQAGYEKAWGWPVSAETATADGGRQQQFERAVATWHPTGVDVRSK